MLPFLSLLRLPVIVPIVLPVYSYSPKTKENHQSSGVYDLRFFTPEELVHTFEAGQCS